MKLKPKYRAVIYRDFDGEFRAAVFHSNGKEVLRSGEGLERRGSVRKGLEHFLAAVADGRVEIVEKVEPKPRRKPPSASVPAGWP